MRAAPLMLCTAVAFFAATQAASAQAISSTEYDRALRPGAAYTPFDNAPFSHRYFYNPSGAYLYFNRSADEMWYLYYQDRVDRALKFGHELPPEPEPPANPPVYRGRFGLGLGMNRWR